MCPAIQSDSSNEPLDSAGTLDYQPLTLEELQQIVQLYEQITALQKKFSGTFCSRTAPISAMRQPPIAQYLAVLGEVDVFFVGLTISLSRLVSAATNVAKD